MKSAFLPIIAALLLSQSLVAQSLTEQYAAQQTLPLSYVCQRTSAPLKIDGKITEADWKAAASTALFVDISGPGFPVPAQATQARMLWDDQYLYVAATISETNIGANLTQHDAIIYHDNDFEVFLNPEGDGVDYFEIECNARAVVFDLMLDRPYRSGGNFFIPWNCDGLLIAVDYEGTLNKSTDQDTQWTVEMAIPFEAIARNFASTPKAGNIWRINFSRVEWPEGQAHEENWVWSPIGKVDMHCPERWGFLLFADTKAGEPAKPFVYPYDMDAYRLLWTLFYAQQDYHRSHNNYIRRTADFYLTNVDLALLPEDGTLEVDATAAAFTLVITAPGEGKRYTVDQDGRFACTPLERREVKNWAWMNPEQERTLTEWKSLFDLMKDCGLSGVLFEGYDEDIYRLCHEAGLEAHYWKWTMNRKDYLESHPEWYAVNRLGESCCDKPAYVSYYNFLCPNHSGVAEALAADYVRIGKLPYVDGVHLDYMRFPDVVLPVSLWAKYGIEQIQELPEYDYCYCDTCRALFKELTRRDPLEVRYPQEDQSWINFRLDGITRVVETIARAVRQEHIPLSAAVFPGPSMARKMVRQDWGNWPLEAYYPMIYNGFYYEGPSWIGRSVKEAVQAVDGRAAIYAGLMFPDIKDNFEEALDEAYGNGAAGISFFDGPDEEYLLRLKDYIKSHNMMVPE